MDRGKLISSKIFTVLLIFDYIQQQVDENSLDSRVWPRSMALAERLWSDPGTNVINDKETINRFSIFHTRFLDLGLKSEAIFPKYCEQNENECM